MSKQQVTFSEHDNAEIEYEEQELEDDPEVYHQFLTLVDGVVGSVALLQADMDNFLYFKDELMQQMLPPNLLLQLSLISGKLFRSYSDLQFPLWELLRLVRVYSAPWEEKKAALQKMHEDYARKKSQLEIALRRLTTQDADVKRAARERRVMNWEKLFARVQMARGHGRRWKFRMYDFKRRAAMGVEHLGRYFAEDQSDLESEPEQAGDEAGEAEEGEDAAEQPPADGAEAEHQQELEEKSAAAVQEVADEFPDIELESLEDLEVDEPEEALPDGQDEVNSISMPTEVAAPVETVDAEVWTHEPEFARTLRVRVYPARQVKAKQVTVELAFGDTDACAVRLEAQDITERAPAADDKRRMARRRQVGGGDDSSGGGSGGYQEAGLPMPGDADAGGPGLPPPGRQSPALRVSVLDERMDPVGGAVLTVSQLIDAQLVTLDVAPPRQRPTKRAEEGEEEVEVERSADRSDDNSEEIDDEHRRLVDELTPTDYPLLLNDIEAGQLPMLIYWTRYPLHRTADRHNNTASVYELVEDLTGIDLNKVTREELTREKIDACMSPRPMTPQSENIPKEEFEKLNEEFSEKFSQLEKEYVNKLKALEAQLTEQKQQEASQPLPLAVETSERATSAQRSLPGSRRSSGRRREAPTEQPPQEDEPASAAPAKKVGIRVPPRPARPKKNFMVGRPLPAWGEGFPEDFFERMELLGHLTREHKERLVARIRAEIAREVEAQLMELSRLAADDAAADAAEVEDGEIGEASARRADQQADEVTIPALFMPQRGGEHKVYNPRAHMYFQPHGLRGARLTQPPSMLSLPPLPNRPSILNLFDLSTRASHPAGAAGTAISVGMSPNPAAAIQAQLSMLKKAAN